MVVLGKCYCVLFWIVVLRCLPVSHGITASNKENKLLSEEDKRGATFETTSGKDQFGKSKTAKRGLSTIGDDRRPFYDEPGPKRYGDYEHGRYGGSGGGYSNGGLGHYGDDRGPPLYEPDGGYHHSGGGGDFIGGRPSGYGPSYGPSYGPPPEPIYPGGYEDHHHYGHSGYGDQGYSFNKALTLKKVLIPLAGLAILGVAAAAASHNPVLLQLGTLSGRRKRSVPLPDVYPPNPAVKPLKTE